MFLMILLLHVVYGVASFKVCSLAVGRLLRKHRLKNVVSLEVTLTCK